ncbi:hypothetical protein [Delftia sp. CH05]|uniref:hypothetical protein n=1 Tax=Delftia sp. CH05 TaxID=2692194 RepID=UPI00135DC0FD|nr:hypothetical protein [Delftia sp. CH05]MXN30188.1 hypothetical protein [Delftia sp. CH05]
MLDEKDRILINEVDMNMDHGLSLRVLVLRYYPDFINYDGATKASETERSNVPSRTDDLMTIAVSRNENLTAYEFMKSLKALQDFQGKVLKNDS